MGKVKIRHALATYQEHPDGPVLTAFRGQVVDMSQEHIDRLRVHGAIVNPEVELDRPGILLDLPESPSDEELVAWVMAASPAETQDLAQRRPELRARLDGAALRVTDERRRMDEHLTNVRNALSGTPAGTVIDGDIVLGDLEPATGTEEPGSPELTTTSGGEGNTGDEGSNATPAGEPPQPASLATLVQGNVQSVTEYVRANPDEADDVLEAESEARNGSPRAGVVAAVQAIKAARGQ